MKSKIMALALFTATAVAVLFYPHYQTIGAAIRSPNQAAPILQSDGDPKSMHARRWKWPSCWIPPAAWVD